MSAPSHGRQVSLGPGIPRVDIEPLDLPTEPAPKTGELKPCPFCGSTAALRLLVIGGDGVVCMTTRGGCGATLRARSHRAAVSCWNRRAPVTGEAINHLQSNQIGGQP